MARDAVLYLTPDEITVPDGRRSLDQRAVEALVQSIKDIGLQHPITCRSLKGGGFELVAGHHRLEALRRLGEEGVPATIVKWSDQAARKWEIAENLHRADLSELQRKEQIAEWIAITDAERREAHSAQVAPIESRRDDNRGHRPESGINAAARDLGVERTEAQRAVKIASISEQAKQAAIEAHIDNNQSALLKIARADPDRQLAVVAEIAEAKATKLDTDIKNRAAEEMAEAIVEHMPHALHGMMKENAWVCAKPLAIALTNLLGGAVMDKGAA